MEKRTLERLRSQMSRAELVLFTGAGFSTSAKNLNGAAVPVGRDLAESLWPLAFPSEPFDADSQLAEIFQVALTRNRASLQSRLKTLLSVAHGSIPEFYRVYFSCPWHRVYTLNIDDLPNAVERQFGLPRRIRALSSSQMGTSRVGDRDLEVIHLNGSLADPCEDLVFSEAQYGRRHARADALYQQCSSELWTRPTVFVGTPLRESLLWHYLEVVRLGTPVGRVQRPTSVLVTPELPLARRALLEDLRIEWVSMTAEQFATSCLAELSIASEKGHRVFGAREADGTAQRPLRMVSDLAGENPGLDTDFLLGAEPHWSDILMGRAARRTSDDDLLDLALRAIERGGHNLVTVGGTAGSGKSTALMRLGLSLTYRGLPVLWSDREWEWQSHQLSDQLRAMDEKFVVIVDDADLRWRSLPGVLKMVAVGASALVVLGARSSRMEKLEQAVQGSTGLRMEEFSIPNLDDSDIDELVSVLAQAGRLGVLTGLSGSERRQAFTRNAGRQLLVAMIKATSGRELEEKVEEELIDLATTERLVYSVVCLATRFHHYLEREEVVLAAGSGGPGQTDQVARLIGRHLVRSTPPQYRLRARHRMIADLVFECLERRGELGEAIRGLAYAIALKVNPGTSRHGRLWRLMRSLLSHDFIRKVLRPNEARELFAELEEYQKWNYQYWLQRGSYELESDNLRTAENYLGAARSLADGDPFVETEWAYYLTRSGLSAPLTEERREKFEEGISLLETLAENRGRETPYPFHVLGAQVLRWAEALGESREEKRSWLERAKRALRTGLEFHPGHSGLARISHELERAILETVVRA